MSATKNTKIMTGKDTKVLLSFWKKDRFVINYVRECFISLDKKQVLTSPLSTVFTVYTTCCNIQKLNIFTHKMYFVCYVWYSESKIISLHSINHM